MIRTFVAVFPPNDVSSSLDEAVEGFRRVAPEAKWVAPANFHFTMRFLGDLPEERLDLLTRCVAESIREQTPFEVTLEGLGAFPSPAKPRVLWVGTGSGGEALARLAKIVEMKLRSERFGKADKRFSPHLTIARWRRPQRSEAVKRMIETSSLKMRPFKVEAVNVMESKLKPRGPEYIVRAACPLEG